MPGDTSPARTTDEALTKIAEKIRSYSRSAIRAYIEVGNQLAYAKKLAGHGRFSQWLHDEFEMSADTAERLIRCSQYAEQIPHVADFDMSVSVLYEITKASTPEPARKEIVERLEAGEVMTVAAARETISKAKPARVVKRSTLPVAPPPREPSPAQTSTMVAVHHEADISALKSEEDEPLSTRVHNLFNDLMALLQANENWPPLSKRGQQRRTKALKALGAVRYELSDLLATKPPARAAK